MGPAEPPPSVRPEDGSRPRVAHAARRGGAAAGLRRRRPVALAAVVVCIGLALLALWRLGRSPPPLPMATPVDLRAAAPAAPAVADAPPPEPAAASAAIASTAPAPPDPCTSATPDERAEARRNGLRRLTAALAASRSEMDRGLAWVLRARAADGRPRRDAASGRQETATRHLVALAQASGDTHLLALAHDHCSAQPYAGADTCTLIDGWTWAHRDPDNAAAWIALAGEARGAGNEALLAEAIAAAAHAGRVEHVGFQLLRLLDRPELAEMPALMRSAVSDAIVEAWSGWPMPAMSPLAAWCADAGVATDRLPACGDLARLLAERGSSLLDVALAANLASRAGWPAGEVGALRELHEAAAQRLAELMPARGRCPWSKDAARRVAEIGWFGEMIVARRLLAASAEAGGEPASGPARR